MFNLLGVLTEFWKLSTDDVALRADLGYYNNTAKMA